MSGRAGSLDTGPRLSGPGGLLGRLAGRLLETALEAELTEHLGHPPGGPPRGANVRNGATPKTVRTDLGPVEVGVPRDRDGSFAPEILPKRRTRLAGVDADMVLGLYAGGLSVHEIGRRLGALSATEAGRDVPSRVRDAVLEDLERWRTRPLDAVWPIVSFATVCSEIRADGPPEGGGWHLAVGVARGGEPELLGVWPGEIGVAAPWRAILDELRRRGVEAIETSDVEGLPGCAEALAATFPRALPRARSSSGGSDPSHSGTVSARVTEPRLWTIGYERLLPPELVAELEAAGIERLIDVRFRPQSRRPGMSKTRLGAHLGEHGIAYEHRRGLGTPPEIRWFFKYGRVAEGRERYAAHLEAQPELAELAGELPSAPRTALLCLEADPAECHRRVIAELLAERIPGLQVTDL